MDYVARISYCAPYKVARYCYPRHQKGRRTCQSSYLIKSFNRSLISSPYIQMVLAWTNLLKNLGPECRVAPCSVVWQHWLSKSEFFLTERGVLSDTAWAPPLVT